ncbi:Type 1 glutamine amidotransferase-like domain-containing protein [Erysipelothrix anatis]|uniref:Type 1 glutamine amidotransferase-like domain-containing protein n=1 Tax=Erysipelothrix anatis TaxID=2683713 RepID=UPI001356E3A7|nr:Type 1 glutamine amidotransferase-like domain-containing protein [Erysipelothrix anatis]
MGTIVTIGGGFGERSVAPKIDKKIVELSQKDRPKMLFIPTASSDDAGYIHDFSMHFESLGCDVSSLQLVIQTPNQADVESAIRGSDIIYVSGGDTRFMINHWEQFGIRALLQEAYNDGKVLCGVSAGSICWYVWGNSDSESFSENQEWRFIQTPGLGFIKAAHCPHFNEEGRESFIEMMYDETSIPGLALDNGAALVINGNDQYIIKEDESSRAVFFNHTADGLIQHRLKDGDSVPVSIVI